MTTTHHTKILKQIGHKSAKYQKYLKHNVPRVRTQGMNTKTCIRCGRTGARISKYGINLCRQCFREVATRIGFKKNS